jgi:hypothetical protein
MILLNSLKNMLFRFEILFIFKKLDEKLTVFNFS